MPLFENMPYTNFQDLNLDHIVTKIGQFETSLNNYKDRLDAFEASLTGLESNYSALSAQVTAIRTQLDSVASDVASLNTTVAQHGTIIDSFQTTLTSIEERLTIIVGDITTLYANIDRVETQSKQRDNALGSRVTILESATINPITVRASKVNAVLFGSDLMHTAVDPSTGLPFGMTWRGEAPYPFTYVEGEGLVIGDDYWNSKYIKIQSDCFLLNRNASYDITLGIFSANNGRDPWKVVTATVQPEYGNPWTYFTSDERLCCDIEPNGNIDIAFRNSVPDDYEGKVIRYIYVCEHEAGVEPDDRVRFNRRDGVMAQAIATMISNAIPETTEEHYTDDIETDWYPDWSGTGTESGITATVNLWQNGKVGVGNISLFSPYEDDPIGNGESNSVTVDISDLEIPKINNQGLVGQYVSVVTGEQYNVYLTNGSDYCDTMVITHSFPSTITPQNNGHFATIPIHVSFQ